MVTGSRRGTLRGGSSRTLTRAATHHRTRPWRGAVSVPATMETAACLLSTPSRPPGRGAVTDYAHRYCTATSSGIHSRPARRTVCCARAAGTGSWDRPGIRDIVPASVLLAPGLVPIRSAPGVLVAAGTVLFSRARATRVAPRFPPPTVAATAHDPRGHRRRTAARDGRPLFITGARQRCPANIDTATIRCFNWSPGHQIHTVPQGRVMAQGRNSDASRPRIPRGFFLSPLMRLRGSSPPPEGAVAGRLPAQILFPGCRFACPMAPGCGCGPGTPGRALSYGGKRTPRRSGCRESPRGGGPRRRKKGERASRTGGSSGWVFCVSSGPIAVNPRP